MIKVYKMNSEETCKNFLELFDIKFKNNELFFYATFSEEFFDKSKSIHLFPGKNDTTINGYAYFKKNGQKNSTFYSSLTLATKLRTFLGDKEKRSIVILVKENVKVKNSHFKILSLYYREDLNSLSIVCINNIHYTVKFHKEYMFESLYGTVQGHSLVPVLTPL